MFPLLMIGFAALGFVLASRPELLGRIDASVRGVIPNDFASLVTGLMDTAIASRATVGVIGIAAALWAGLGWMGNLRTALSVMWGQPDVEGSFVRRKLSDLAALASAFVAILLTIGLSALADPALRLAAPVRVASLLSSVAVSWLLFTWMIAKLPRTPVSLRAAARAGLLAGVGFELLKQLGSAYLRIVLHGPAGAAFGPVLGLMVFAYLTARLVLFATAWAATSRGVSAPVPADSTNAQP